MINTHLWINESFQRKLAITCYLLIKVTCISKDMDFYSGHKLQYDIL